MRECQEGWWYREGVKKGGGIERECQEGWWYSEGVSRRVVV